MALAMTFPGQGVEDDVTFLEPAEVQGFVKRRVGMIGKGGEIHAAGLWLLLSKVINSAANNNSSCLNSRGNIGGQGGKHPH